MSFMSILALYCPDAFSKTKKSVIPRAAATKLQATTKLQTSNLAVSLATDKKATMLDSKLSLSKDKFDIKNLGLKELKNVNLKELKSAGLKVCNAGQYLPANLSSCSPCKDRYYCPGGIWEIKSFDQGLKTCVRSTPNAEKTACVISCKAGQYLPANLSSCSPCKDRYYCPGGTFTTGTNTYDQGLKSCLFKTVPNDLKTACVNQNVPSYTCKAGKYLPKNATSCSDCKDRYYVCAGGTFNQSSVAQGILRCDRGQIADSTKTQCVAEIYKCEAGQYLPAKSVKYCRDCKKDYYCTGGSFMYSTTDQGLAQCPAGFHPNDKQTECEKDLPNEVTCGAGFYLPANTMECKRCSDSKRYCPGGKTFKKNDIDQGIFACPLTSVANDDKSACVLTLSKSFMQFGPDETVQLSEQCWADKDSAKYKICLFGNQVVLPENTSITKEE